MSMRTLALVCLVTLLAACGGGGGGNAPAAPPFTGIPPAPTTGTGRLTVTVLNAQRRPVENARVGIVGTGVDRWAVTARDGTVSFDALPGDVRVAIIHALARPFPRRIVVVAQQGATNLEAVLETDLPHPTVALMPVEIVPGSVSADRRMLDLRVKLVASPRGELRFAQDGWGGTSMYVGISLDPGGSTSRRDCNLYYNYWEDPAYVCLTWGDPVYEVTATQFGYRPETRAALQTDPAAAPRTMLLVDQGQRMAQFTTGAARTFAVRQLSDRLVRGAATPRPLAIGGFAGTAAGNTATLPTLPVWLPRGAGAAFSSDATIVDSDIAVLEPLTGGISLVFDALDNAVGIASGGAFAGGATVVAVVGGDDQSGLTASQRTARLAALEARHRDSGVRSILIAAFDPNDVGNGMAIADLAASIGAPYISTGLVDPRHDDVTPGDGLFAAVDLAADLLAGGEMPTMSATVRVRAPAAGAFAAGSLVRGVIYLESDICPVGCQELSLSFTARVP